MGGFPALLLLLALPGMDFGRYPSFSQAALQKDGRNKVSRMPDEELKNSTTYAVVRHQPQMKPEDVIYVNMQPPPEVFFRTQEPPGNSWLFRATTQHSGTEKRKTGPPKQSPTKPWAYLQNFAELRNNPFVLKLDTYGL